MRARRLLAMIFFLTGAGLFAFEPLIVASLHTTGYVVISLVPILAFVAALATGLVPPRAWFILPGLSGLPALAVLEGIHASLWQDALILTAVYVVMIQVSHQLLRRRYDRYGRSE